MPEFGSVDSSLLVKDEPMLHVRAGLLVAVKVNASTLTGTDPVIASAEVVSWKFKRYLLGPCVGILVVSVRNAYGRVGR